MGFDLIDGSFSDTEVTLPSGQVLPAPSLVEGDDGRYLLIANENIPVKVWAIAKISNVDAVIKPASNMHPLKPQIISIDDFEELSILNDETAIYTLPSFIWNEDVPTEVFSEDEVVVLCSNLGTSTPEQPANEAVEAVEPPESFFVHVHTHSEYSALDGYSKVNEMVDRAKELGQKAIAVTDHGNVAAHPYLQDACDEAGIKPLFGMEAYFVNDRFTKEDPNEYWHLTLWAMNDKGLDNLWAMSTESERDGKYNGKGRLDWATLERLNEGVIASSACLRGPVTEPYLRGDSATALANLSYLKEIFGDRFYLEIHANQLEEQKKANHWLVEQGRTFGIPLLAAVDSHYTHAHEQDDHQVWISMQINKDVTEETNLFGGGQKYHLSNDDEVIDALYYLGEDVVVEAMSSTILLADRCDARIRPREGMPIYSVGDNAEEQDSDRLLELCLSNWDNRTEGKNYSQQAAVDRFEKEFPLLVRKGFCGYFLMNADLVNYAKDNGVLVGPGRGSGAGSLVAYLAGITEVDPVENDLLFERFMTEGRTALPDFDIDYPSSRKQFMIDYAQSRWGKNHVVAVGTHTRIKNKGAFKNTARAIRSRLPEDHFSDLEMISAIITAAEASTAGLGLSWDELFDVAGDILEPYRQKMPYLFEMATKFRGRLSTYSRHAAGLVIDPNCDLENSLPMFLAPDGVTLVTQFDKDILERLNYVKFDFLNLRNLDTIQDTVDLIKEQTGIVINVNRWRDEYYDQDVYNMLSEGWTLGVFQLETNLGTKTIKQIRPNCLADISDSITIGRPGPMRSGLDKMFFRRRNGDEKVTVPDKRLEPVLGKTYGAMLYQEDIMATTMVLANYDDNEADYVRKILGKKKKELVEEEGKKFISRSIINNTNEQVAIALWADMAEFALYSFNRAHAFAYATLAYWTAWLKYHYPAQFMTSCLTTIENDEIPEFVQESRRLGYRVLPPDINTSKAGFASAGDTIRYGFESLKGIGESATAAIIAGQPYVTFDDFMERKGDKCNMGHIKILAKIGAFDSLVRNRKALEARLAEDEMKNNERCIFFRIERNEYDLPCAFDWDSEPAPLGRTGKPTKRKPVPKKCTKACRQYVQRPMPDDDDILPYNDAEIRTREMETLGVYLSSSPFDIIDNEDLAMLSNGNEIQTSPDGRYITAILITEVRNSRTRKGDPMKFIKTLTPSGNLDMAVFSNALAQNDDKLNVGTMAFAEVQKNDRGVTLQMMETI